MYAAVKSWKKNYLKVVFNCRRSQKVVNAIKCTLGLNNENCIFEKAVRY